MRKLSVSFLYTLITGASIAQSDSILLSTALSSDHTLMFSTFPTLEYGFTYKHPVKKMWITGSVHGFNFENDNHFDEFIYPYASTDSTMTYRSKVSLTEGRYGFKLGAEFRIPSLFERIVNADFLLRAGCEFAFERYNKRHEYYEGYVRIQRDSNGVIHYLDSNGVATNNAMLIDGENTISAKVEAIYNVWGIHPFISLEYLAKNFPTSIGAKIGFRYNFYQRISSSDNDPLNWVDEYKANYHKFEPMFYLTFSLFLKNEWFRKPPKNEG